LYIICYVSWVQLFATLLYVHFYCTIHADAGQNMVARGIAPGYIHPSSFEAPEGRNNLQS